MKLKLTRVVIRHAKCISSVVLNDLVSKHELPLEINGLSQPRIRHLKVVIEDLVSGGVTSFKIGEHNGSLRGRFSDETEQHRVLSFHFIPLGQIHKLFIVVVEPLSKGFLHYFLVVKVDVAPILGLPPQRGLFAHRVHPPNAASGNFRLYLDLRFRKTEPLF